jgi:hypothetical protein
MILVLQLSEHGRDRIDDFRRPVVARSKAAHTLRGVLAIAVARPKNRSHNGIWDRGGSPLGKSVVVCRRRSVGRIPMDHDDKDRMLAEPGILVDF